MVTLESLEKHFFGFALIVLLFLLFLIIFSGKGLLDLNRRIKEKNNWQTVNLEEGRKIMDLKRVISRLKSEPDFIEFTIRKDLKLVGQDELVINIKKPDQNIQK